MTRAEVRDQQLICRDCGGTAVEVRVDGEPYTGVLKMRVDNGIASPAVTQDDNWALGDPIWGRPLDWGDDLL